MGVHGLWDLLAPVGRRVSVETLAGKKLAIDASIWMVQFMKAMRDEKGEMVRNAHVLGFFRRICKLLFLRTKPVFVFDGGTPALKRRTVIARRRQRENAQAKIRKTAEKLLLNHLKAMKLKELAKELQNQKQKNDAKGKTVLSDQTDTTQSNSEKNGVVSRSHNQEELDELLAASIAAEEDGSLAKNASSSTATIPGEEDDDEEMILLEAEKLKELVKGIKNQKQKNDATAKAKKVLVNETDMMESNSERNDVVSRTYNQEELDEMLSASIAAEEDGIIINNTSSSAAGIYEEDEDEEMILPAMHGKVDPAVLAVLPPSMQLDLLVQMREKLMAENRQKYQKVKKAPEKFSELQIQAYLKTVAFRREIDEVQKSAAGRGVGGVQTSRIASEANREFIFSSSFTGDKQALSSAGVERSGDKQQNTPREHPSSDSMNSILSTRNSDNVTELVPEEPRSVFDDDVETYMDERGFVRVSRVRAMGIRMTRDLQRNLDLMKEIEQERTSANKIKTALEVDDESVNLNERNEEPMLKNETTIEISFEDKGQDKCSDVDDDIFARLVAGDPVIISCPDNTPSIKQSTDSVSDSDWEEGIIEGQGNSLLNDGKPDIKSSLKEGSISDESEVEWEEGDCDVLKSTSSCPSESGKTVSRGSLEEEADLQEAIRRSLEDLGGEKPIHASFEDEKFRSSGEKVYEEIGFLHLENNMVEPNILGENVTQQKESFCELVDGVENPDSVGGMNISQTIGSPVRQLNSSVAYNPDKMEIQINKPCERYLGSRSEQSMKDVSESGNSYREIPSTTKEVHLIVEQPLDTSNEGGVLPTFAKRHWRDNPSISGVAVGDLNDTIQVDDKKSDSGAEPSHHLVETTNHATPLVESSTKESMKDVLLEQKLTADENHDNFFKGREHEVHKFAINDDEKVQVEVTEASLEEEMLILGEACMNLENEQRKLERNAESVSSEMFAECQELLQMFGLPYIIAPMEAEAQCAYMELANLVDGVVTDDSDVFLFGARSVYKNIFDDRKYVETYFMKDVENELGLNREKIIRMALLLGSDYTEGVSGIGIVNAIEVVNAFPDEDGLRKFREWIESPDPTILEKFDVRTGSSSRKRESKVSDSDLNHAKSQMEGVSAVDQNVSQAHEHEQSVDYIQDVKQMFMDKHRNVSKNWHIPDSFPSEAVMSAYASPQVDKSTEPFSWGKPDLLVLRRLCWEKFGWGNQKADELLLPVLKEYNKHETQLRLEAFYTFNERFAKIRSKRIKKAVKGITRNKSLELMDDAVQEFPKSRKKRRVSPSELGDKRSERHSKGTEEDVARIESNSTANSTQSTPKQYTKRRIRGEPVPSQMENPEPSMQTEGRQSTNKKSSGSGRGGGRGRGRGAGRGRRKVSPGFELFEPSSSDGNGDDQLEVRVEKLEGPQVLRRSTRSRRPVKFTLNDLENEGVDKSLDLSDKECSNGEAVEQEPSWAQGIGGDPASVLDEKKKNKAGDPSPTEGSCREYLEKGSGFFMAEDEISELGMSQSGDPSSVAESSKDYLKMGGGFCMDEGETVKDEDNARNPASATTGEVAEAFHHSDSMDQPASATTGEVAEAFHHSDSMDQPERDIGSVQSISSPKRAFNGLQDGERTDEIEQSLSSSNATINDHSKVGVYPQGNPEDDTGAISVRGLSAMPFLRRKRRKS